MTALRPTFDAAAVPLTCRAEPRQAVTFRDVYEAEFPFLWRNACRLGVEPAHLDDIVQETFVIVYRRLPEFEGRSSLRTWLFGILHNVVRAHRRSVRASHHHLPPPAADDADRDSVVDASAGPDECVARTEAARVVMHLLNALDDDKRVVFMLAELEQMSAPDIALALGVPLNTVYSRLRLARTEFAAAAARHRACEHRRTR